MKKAGKSNKRWGATVRKGSDYLGEEKTKQEMEKGSYNRHKLPVPTGNSTVGSHFESKQASKLAFSIVFFLNQC